MVATAAVPPSGTFPKSGLVGQLRSLSCMSLKAGRLRLCMGLLPGTDVLVALFGEMANGHSLSEGPKGTYGLSHIYFSIYPWFVGRQDGPM